MEETILVTVMLPLILSCCTDADKSVGFQQASNFRSEQNVRFEKATFAGGCFWCMESAFEDLEGVVEVTTGYTGGHKDNPTYKEVSAGGTGHVEAVQVIFDPSTISYSKLLDLFWRQIDPTDPTGQFVDKGSQYRAAIFYHNKKQKSLALKSKGELNESGRYDRPIVTEIQEAAKFYKAEQYHQDYYKKCPVRYKSYRDGSGREQYLKMIWGDKMKVQYHKGGNEKYKRPTEEELKEKLTPLQYKVTQENSTERPFDNKYWDSNKEGIYIDVVSGEPLFSSLDKYESGTGWPCFREPLVPENIIEKEDKSFSMERTEVRSKHADSHLGHVFLDGHEPTGLRYCINSASLRFIPREDLEKEGYGEYKDLFER